MKRIIERFSDARFFAGVETAEAWACMGTAIPDWEYSLMYWRWVLHFLIHPRRE